MTNYNLVCNTLPVLIETLKTKPRTQAYVYIGQDLYNYLKRNDMKDLKQFRGSRSTPYRDTLELRYNPGNTPYEFKYWVVYVKYDDGYETPDEFGDPSVDWVESDGELDIRDISKLNLE